MPVNVISENATRASSLGLSEIILSIPWRSEFTTSRVPQRIKVVYQGMLHIEFSGAIESLGAVVSTSILSLVPVPLSSRKWSKFC